MMTAVVLAASASAVFSDLQSSVRVEMHLELSSLVVEMMKKLALKYAP